MQIALFVACFNDMLFPEVGRATVRILEALGHEVVFPQSQTCCGQIHFNTGYRDACVPLVHGFVEAFEPFDIVVTPSASCAAMIRHHHGTVARHAGDAELEDRVRQVAPRVLDLTEFLSDVAGGRVPGGCFPHAVVLHTTCHSTRLLGVGDRPRHLLEAVPELELIELASADACCGFGGTFAVKNEASSVAMGNDKVAAIEASGAEILTAADTSCLMHIGGLMSRRGSRMRVMHLAEILAAGLPA